MTRVIGRAWRGISSSRPRRSSSTDRVWPHWRTVWSVTIDLPFDLTMGQFVVIALRLLVPLLIPRFPFWGVIAALLLDATDVIIVEFFGPGGMGDHYHQLDKFLDLYYLGIAAWMSLRWTEFLPRRISIGLFAFRLVGVLLFELVGARWILFVFPNLFENWYLFVAGRDRFVPTYRLDSRRRCGMWLLLLYVPKLGQEYLLHVAQAQPWSWFKKTVLGD